MSSHTNLKRQFVPVSSSTFNPAKKFKPSFNPQSDSLSSSFSTSSSAPQFSLHTSQPFPLYPDHHSIRSSKPSAEDVKMEIIHSRPKFKARPIPKIQSKPSNSFPLTPRSSSVQQTTAKSDFKPIPTQESVHRTHSCTFSPNFSYKFEAKPLPDFYSTIQKPQKTPVNETFKFTAKPMPNFSNVFVPVMTFTPTQPVGFDLNTEKRATERSKFEALMKDKENFINEQKLLEARMEEEEVRNYRKTLGFKARPLQIISPFLVKRSEEELTRPKSPVLMTKMRAGMRECGEDDMEID